MRLDPYICFFFNSWAHCCARSARSRSSAPSSRSREGPINFTHLFLFMLATTSYFFGLVNITYSSMPFHAKKCYACSMICYRAGFIMPWFELFQTYSNLRCFCVSSGKRIGRNILFPTFVGVQWSEFSSIPCIPSLFLRRDRPWFPLMRISSIHSVSFS